MKYCMHCIAFIDDEKLTRPMQLRLMHPFGSSSFDCALFTCALIVSPLQRDTIYLFCPTRSLDTHRRGTQLCCTLLLVNAPGFKMVQAVHV